MRGSIRQRGKSGRWYAILDVKGSDGRRKRKWHALQAKGKREAENETAGLVKTLADRTYAETTRLTVDQFMRDRLA